MNMEKISVSIRIPALDITHDFIVPSTMKIMDVRQLVAVILFSEYSVKNLVSNIVLSIKVMVKLCVWMLVLHRWELAMVLN